jgi:hypothetical protein
MGLNVGQTVCCGAYVLVCMREGGERWGGSRAKVFEIVGVCLCA